MTDLRDVWKNVLLILETMIQRRNLVTWFQNTAPLKNENGVFTLGVASPFKKEWIQARYMPAILSSLQQFLPEVKEVVLEVDARLDNVDDARRVAMPVDAGAKRVRRVAQGQEVSFGDGLRSKTFQTRYRLDSFIAGRNNRLPHAAASAAATSPGGIYNPLFVFGNVGLGKTHLLQGVGNQLIKNFPDMCVVYVTAERFVTEIIQGIRTKRMTEVKDKYRRADCLIVDDIQFFGFKETTQDEFFHTLNDLHDAGKQILMSSDRPPKDLDGLDDRLRSRCGMGMVVELLPPEYETRIAILQQKCAEAGVFVDQEVLSCIAFHVETNVRDLDGVLKAVLAAQQFEGKTLTVELALEKIQQLHKAVEVRESFVAPVAKPMRGFVRDIEPIVSAVSRYFRISKQDLISVDRRREVLMPRQICMYLIREVLDEAYEKIGADFGGKNHTTVLHACNKIQSLMKEDQRVVRDVAAIKHELGVA